MRILIYFGHPAHFYTFKNVLPKLKEDGCEVEILVKKKDVLEQVLDNTGVSYHNILKEGRRDSRLGMICGILKRAIRLNAFCSKFHPDLLVGTSVENSFIGHFRHIPVINLNEDDVAVGRMYARLSYPWADVILSPSVCDNERWNGKTIKYSGYHELAYLHPSHFTPDRKKVEKYVSADSPYFLIRLSKLNAYHDTGIRGLDNEVLERLLAALRPFGRVFISSERELPSQFSTNRLSIDPIDIHHVIAFASLFICDSQTMAAEAGVLGVPFIRFNDFVGRIGYLREIEEVYQLGFGVKPDNSANLFTRIEELLNMPDRQAVFQERRKKMLSDKINFATFLQWFIENYPLSKCIMKENPDYQLSFK